jgi:hypothetical protein
MGMNPPLDNLQVRIHGDPDQPTLIYLPGIHGDWTLITSFRLRMQGRVRFVEFSYPRTLTWTLADYATAVLGALKSNGISEGWLLGESFSSQVDPIVPALPVRWWLQRHCPGYRGAKLILRADHNVLGTAPRRAADQIRRWLKEEGAGSPSGA